MVVDFWAPWCGPCRMVAPELERVAAANAGRLIVVKVNTDAVPELGDRFRIRSIPTMAVFDGGKEVARTTGRDAGGRDRGIRPQRDSERLEPAPARSRPAVRLVRYDGRMHRPHASAAADLAARFGAFVLERHPFGAAAAIDAFRKSGGLDAHTATDIEDVRVAIGRELASALQALAAPGPNRNHAWRPGRTALCRGRRRAGEACDGFLRRAAIGASLTPDERREILRGMVLTRATDNRLKTFFTSGEVRYGDAPFQGKGFRSLGQEAIYAAGDPAAARRRVSRRTAAGTAT